VSITGQGDDEYRESDHVVQRTWSNAAAKAGHDPCVPAPPPSQKPYFNASPKNGDVVTLAVGKTTTIVVDAFSDGPLASWETGVQEVTQAIGGTNVLEISMMEQTLSNGQQGHISVTLKATPSQGAAAFWITSQSGEHDPLTGPCSCKTP